MDIKHSQNTLILRVVFYLLTPNLVNSFIKFPALGEIGGWVELGRTTLGSPGQKILITGIADKQYLTILTNMLPNGTNDLSCNIRFNEDAAGNYSRRGSGNGGIDVTAVGSTEVGDTGGISINNQVLGVHFVQNLSGENKLLLGYYALSDGTGSANIPDRRESFGKWANTSAAIDDVEQSTGDPGLGTGSEVVVLGWDPDDTHTTNFWELQGTESSTSTINNIETSFTAKKYLWVQAWIGTTAAANWAMRLGSTTIDTGSNYSYRQSDDGTSDTSNINQNRGIIDSSGGGFVGPMFLNAFIINNASNEKLVYWHTVWGNTAGAGNPPHRAEGVFKWDNASNQADILSVGTFNQTFTKSELRVWGAN